MVRGRREWTIALTDAWDIGRLKDDLNVIAAKKENHENEDLYCIHHGALDNNPKDTYQAER